MATDIIMDCINFQKFQMGGKVNITEGTLLTALEEFTPDWYHTQTEGTALHFAAEMGLTVLVKQMLALGYTNQLGVKDNEGLYPVDCAVKEEHFDTAEVILKGMTTHRLMYYIYFNY